METTRAKMQTIEKEAYAKRQFMLEQVEAIRKRELALNRQTDMHQRQVTLGIDLIIWKHARWV